MSVRFNGHLGLFITKITETEPEISPFVRHLFPVFSPLSSEPHEKHRLLNAQDKTRNSTKKCLFLVYDATEISGRNAVHPEGREGQINAYGFGETKRLARPESKIVRSRADSR